MPKIREVLEMTFEERLFLTLGLAGTHFFSKVAKAS